MIQPLAPGESLGMPTWLQTTSTGAEKIRSMTTASRSITTTSTCQKVFHLIAKGRREDPPGALERRPRLMLMRPQTVVGIKPDGPDRDNAGTNREATRRKIVGPPVASPPLPLRASLPPGTVTQHVTGVRDSASFVQ